MQLHQQQLYFVRTQHGSKTSQQSQLHKSAANIIHSPCESGFLLHVSNEEVPVASSTKRVSTAAASKARPELGHQATHLTGALRAQVRVQRPVRTSHSFTAPSSEAEASHWPVGSADMLRTCTMAQGRVYTEACGRW